MNAHYVNAITFNLKVCFPYYNLLCRKNTVPDHMQTNLVHYSKRNEQRMYTKHLQTRLEFQIPSTHNNSFQTLSRQTLKELVKML